MVLVLTSIIFRALCIAFFNLYVHACWSIYLCVHVIQSWVYSNVPLVHAVYLYFYLQEEVTRRLELAERPLGDVQKEKRAGEKENENERMREKAKRRKKRAKGHKEEKGTGARKEHGEAEE